MRLLLLATCLIAAAAAEDLIANVPSPEQAPTFREAEQMHARITVRNPYARAIRIDRLDSTCSCSKLEIGSRFLVPGESTVLELASENIRRSGPQKVRVSLFVTDPDFEPIEVWCWWKVQPAVTVDAVPPGTPAIDRPENDAWRDVYRYVAHERPDEPQRLRKRIRLGCPATETPTGGLRVDGIDYTGTLWAFETRPLEGGAILLTATARDQQGPLTEGVYDETVIVRTNHPDKPRIQLHFSVQLDTKAGSTAKDMLQGAMGP